MHTCSTVLARLRAMANPASAAGMARYGISTRGLLGVGIPAMRRLAKETGRDHALALALWDSGVHEARILASLVAEPERLTAAQMNRWVRELDSWDICDQLCNNLLRRSPEAHARAVAWSQQRGEFVRRAGFTLMAVLAVHDKAAPDAVFAEDLRLIEQAAGDGRNFVKKAVNWALRQIGKRNPALCRAAIASARRILQQDTPSARWIARDALRELERRAR